MTPLTKLEHFLGKIAGNPSAQQRTPKNRYEELLNEIAQADYAKEPKVVNIAVTSKTIQAEDNTIYNFTAEAVSSIAVSSFPEDGLFSICFVSGAVPTVFSVPQELHMPNDFSVETAKRYEINVNRGYAICNAWGTGGEK